MAKSGSPIFDSGEIGVWEIHTNRQRLPDGTVVATLKDSAYPEGWSDNIITANIKGDNPREVITSWFNFVRSRFNAWETSQEAAAIERAKALVPSSQPEAAPSVQHGGGGESGGPAVQDSEASLEELLESKISTLRRFISSIEGEIAETTSSLAVLKEKRRKGVSDLRKAERAKRAAK